MIGALYIMKLKFNALDILKNGKAIIVKIVDVPVTCGEGGKIKKSYFRFAYQGKIYSKNFHGKHCEEITKGKSIILKTDIDKSIFIFTDEDVIYDVAAFGGLAAMFGIFALISQFKKEKI